MPAVGALGLFGSLHPVLLAVAGHDGSRLFIGSRDEELLPGLAWSGEVQTFLAILLYRSGTKGIERLTLRHLAEVQRLNDA